MIKKTIKCLKAARGLERLGLISGDDWKTLKVLDGDYRKKLVDKIIDNAAKIGKLKY